MTLEVKLNHFTQREQAIAEIEADGLRLVETDVPAERLIATAHSHPHRVDIYILDGIFELHDPDTGITHKLERGSKTIVRANALHAEHSPAGFRAAFGLSVDPAVAMAESAQH